MKSRDETPAQHKDAPSTVRVSRLLAETEAELDRLNRAGLQEQLARTLRLVEQELGEVEKIWRGFLDTWSCADAAQSKDLLHLVPERVSLNERIVETITLRPAFFRLARHRRDLMGQTDGQVLGLI